MSSFLHYFAYGSNLHPSRLHERTSSCKIIGPARLNGYALRFHKRGVDGTAKCNAFCTNNELDIVYGVIYQISPHDKGNLDQAESVGCGYNQEMLTVIYNGTERKVFTYIAHHDYIDESLRPYTWYKDFVVKGAEYHQLPEWYIDSIQEIQTVEDPDRSRAERNIRLNSL